MTFRTTLLLGGKTATGIEIPAEIVEGLGAGKRPPVRVTINGHTYRSTVAVMGGTRQRRIAKSVARLGATRPTPTPPPAAGTASSPTTKERSNE